LREVRLPDRAGRETDQQQPPAATSQQPPTQQPRLQFGHLGSPEGRLFPFARARPFAAGRFAAAFPIPKTYTFKGRLEQNSS